MSHSVVVPEATGVHFGSGLGEHGVRLRLGRESALLELASATRGVCGYVEHEVPRAVLLRAGPAPPPAVFSTTQEQRLNVEPFIVSPGLGSGTRPPAR